ncbi:MAG: hypothetical protein HWE25_15915 [Alphaproteobacteria bacterium]|nr:hypothetical protein [Alphaproteobacteria bacterium]
MPFNLPENIILAIHYIAFIGQIYLISHYFPARFAQRIRYILRNFPVSEYPKLYPSAGPNFADETEDKLRLFLRVNSGIAVIGLLLLGVMFGNNYSIDPKGGDEVFVMMYFFLQVIPFLIAGYKEHTQYAAMRKAFSETRRKADLRPRRLFDFISPAAVLAAVLSYSIWLVFYLNIKGSAGPWGEEVYISVGLTTTMNLIYAAVIARFIYGKKLDPYQASKDHMKTIEAITKALVYSSIGISWFHVMTVAADEYALEAFDPALSSIYMQFCAALGFGLMLSIVKVEDLDFDVYRETSASGKQ